MVFWGSDVYSWWHLRQVNDAVASERSIFSENHGYKSFFRIAVNPYEPIFRRLDARGGRKLRTDSKPHCAPRVNYNFCVPSIQAGKLVFVVRISVPFTSLCRRIAR